MKNLFIAAILVGGLAGAMTQALHAQTTDTVKKKSEGTANHEENVFTIRWGKKKSLEIRNDNDSTKLRQASKGRFLGGITFTRVDLGFTKLIDNGSFNLSPTNEFLSYKGVKTSTVSFDVLQFGYRFNPHFKVYIAGGFDWTLIRLRNDITIQKATPNLEYVEEDIHFKKNRFSNSYAHIPLNFEFRSKENDNGKRFYFIVGPEVSFLLNGKVKQVSEENGKVKYKDDYNFQTLRYGGTARIGYGGLGLFTKYYFNDMFDSPAQKGLKYMSFGVTFGLN
ncbi:outer membrane beta-barrel protein [Pedobacter sp.]|uniref:outer membrane beta-barrel protein n=1 Tax=Pedobacter sp. TaxID=1411316 RepID=UPI003D7FB8DC